MKAAAAPTKKPMPARKARLIAGFDMKAAARIGRVTPAHLGQCERTGKFSYVLALKLQRAYGCELGVFCGIKGLVE